MLAHRFLIVSWSPIERRAGRVCNMPRGSLAPGQTNRFNLSDSPASAT
ncbi:MAG: hypothetical protein ACRYGI_20765 [Janthinobacterium lividum]